MNKNVQIRQEIWQEVELLSDEQLNQKPSPDHWSIAQILEHLYLTELSVAHQMKKAAERTDTPIPEAKPIQLTLDRSRRVYVPTPAIEPSVGYKTLDSLKEKLYQSRQVLTCVLQDLTPDQLKRSSMPHPLFGAMSLKQWVEFVGLHEQRHLEQIKETKERLFS
jgi:hypothetical protein